MDSSAMDLSAMESSIRQRASPPSRTAAIIFLYIYLYPCRTSCPKSSTCFFFSDISIFLRRKCYTGFFFSDISNLYAMRHGFVRLGFVGHGFVRHGFVRHGIVRHGIVRHGIVQRGFVRRSYTSQKKRKGSRPSRSSEF